MKNKIEYLNRLETFSTCTELSSYEIEKLVEHSMCTNLLNSYDEVVDWVEKKKGNLIEIIPLENLRNWKVAQKN